MAPPEVLEPPPVPRRWAALTGGDNWLVHAVARVPANVRTKLLVAFLGIAALLVVVGVLGLRFLGQANGRVERLGTLQERSAAYDTIQTEATLLRQLLGFRGGGESGPAILTGAKVSYGVRAVNGAGVSGPAVCGFGFGGGSAPAVVDVCVATHMRGLVPHDRVCEMRSGADLSGRAWPVAAARSVPSGRSSRRCAGALSSPSR
jgi:hypothetical protein